MADAIKLIEDNASIRCEIYSLITLKRFFMKSITLKGSERESVGKVSTNALRNAGRVPCVIYGGENPVHFSVEAKDLNPLVYTPDALIVDLELASGKKFKAALQDIQFHPVTENILHRGFHRTFRRQARYDAGSGEDNGTFGRRSRRRCAGCQRPQASRYVLFRQIFPM